MGKSLTSHGTSINYKWLHTERGIAFFEGGWWMLEEDRQAANRQLNDFRPVALRRNEETKQVTIDGTIYP